MLQKLKSFLVQGNRAQWCVFFLFAFAIFLKCVLFHWFCFHGLLMSSLLKHPLNFILFYIPKIAPAVILASFIFATKRKWWTIVVLLLIDLWSISNLIYYRANELFLNIDAILMVNNMQGFWSSVATYYLPSFSWMFVITIIYSFFLILIWWNIKSTKRIWFQCIICLLIGMILHVLGHYYEYSYTPKGLKDEVEFQNINGGVRQFKSWRQLIPLRNVINSARWYQKDWEYVYIKEQSIAQYALAICVYKLFYPRPHSLQKEKINIPEMLLSKGLSQEHVPNNNLIIFLVESLESWVFANEKMKIANNMSQLLNNSHVLYCDKIKSQVRQGTSGDGQMILNTGLLPTQVGAACMMYDENVYPNFAHLYDSTFIINPASGSWNQIKASHNYGYKRLLQSPNKKWIDDSITSNQLDSLVSLGFDNYCIMLITIASHTPFDMVPINASINTIIAPKAIKQYMSSIMYTDSCMGHLLNRIMTDPVKKNTTIVITGDHTIFKESTLQEYRSKTTEFVLPNETFCPLIIYSPKIKQNLHITDTCYQMDIYPTIMHLIGCEDYYWKGVGVNLLDSVARNNRSISEQEAYELSDKLIRSNYFATLNK